jgi:hypothetical protein
MVFIGFMYLRSLERNTEPCFLEDPRRFLISLYVTKCLIERG